MDIHSDELVVGNVYKVYDRNKNNTLVYGAAEFQGEDEQGNKFELLNRPTKQYAWIRKDELNYSFTKISWQKDYKKKKK